MPALGVTQTSRPEVLCGLPKGISVTTFVRVMKHSTAHQSVGSSMHTALCSDQYQEKIIFA